MTTGSRGNRTSPKIPESTLTCLFRDFRTRCGPTGVSRHELWSINMELKYLFLKTKLPYLTSAHFGCFKRLRSEEHTSELQSRFDLVCRLLLEKKKKSNLDC